MICSKADKSVASLEDKNGVYRAPDGEPPNTKTGGPWASKRAYLALMFFAGIGLADCIASPLANYMANGLDFFVQLRKGITTLQHSANTPSI